MHVNVVRSESNIGVMIFSFGLKGRIKVGVAFGNMPKLDLGLASCSIVRMCLGDTG